MPLLLAQADAVKWTDVGTFWATAVQAAVVIIALVVAYVQYQAALRGDRVRLTIDVFNDIQSRASQASIGRISQNLDYHDDWPVLQAQLALAETDANRIRLENDLWVVNNLYSRIHSLYRESLISREMFLDEYDEISLQICGAVTGVNTIYTQPDYEGLFAIGRLSRENYRRRNGRYAFLRDLAIPN
jgi:hypothetical protein